MEKETTSAAIEAENYESCIRIAAINDTVKFTRVTRLLVDRQRVSLKMLDGTWNETGLAALKETFDKYNQEIAMLLGIPQGLSRSNLFDLKPTHVVEQEIVEGQRLVYNEHKEPENPNQ